MQWANGTKHNPTNDNRVTYSHTASYTVYKSGTNYYAESNLVSGTDYGPLANAATIIQNAIDALA